MQTTRKSAEIEIEHVTKETLLLHSQSTHMNPALMSKITRHTRANNNHVTVIQLFLLLYETC